MDFRMRRAAASATFASSLALACFMSHAVADETPPSHLPTVRREHEHARALLQNAMRYVAPENRIFDLASGYPVEGWNQDPANGLFLRSFTQLTAIGQGMELFANVAAGFADTPHLSREEALANLTRVVKSLRQDQRDPTLSARGLLVNFLDLATGKRLGPLASDLEKSTILDAFGPAKGEAIWKALQSKGWIVERNQGREAAIQRVGKYGMEGFDGALAPFRDDVTKQKIMAILDQRVVLLVFGDNANLSASVAKTIGALLHPDIKDDPGVKELREELERFLDDQRDGYAHLYDPRAGLFNFGWDATRDRLFGWEDLQGKWVTGHMDYLVNEFRGPATFVVIRFGVPSAAIGNLGFKMKPYRTRDGRELYVLAPWEGSAFQAMGLGLMMSELERPSWRTLLTNVVDVEIDDAARRRLPGFLSESYTGNGVQYTGSVGIPEITVSPRPRIMDAASLYTLGAAYTIAPEKVERFLAANWPIILTLLTDHGPWEGYNATRREPIRFQTSAHTLSLILGLLGTAPGNMRRYLESKGLDGRPREIFPTGEEVDFLADGMQVFAWDDKGSSVRSRREEGAFHVTDDRVNHPGIAFVTSRPEGINLSGGILKIRFRSAGPTSTAILALKPMGGAPADGLIPIEIVSKLDDTGGREKEVQVPLPATPGLTRIKEVVITLGEESRGRPLDLTITRLTSRPPEAPGPTGKP